MSKITKSLIAMAISCASFTALAGDYKLYAQAEGGYFFHKGISSDLFENSELQAHLDGKNRTFGYMLRFGYLTPTNAHFSYGLELGFLDLGHINYDIVPKFGHHDHEHSREDSVEIGYKQRGMDMMLVAQYRWDNGLALFGKAGVAAIRQSVDIHDAEVSVKPFDSATKALPELAIGLGYQITPNIAITSTVSHIFGKQIDSSSVITDVAGSTSGMLGIKFVQS
jgi:OmpA-like transmembrane domain